MSDASNNNDKGIVAVDDSNAGPQESTTRTKGGNEHLIGIIVGVLGALVLLAGAVVLIVIFRSRKKKSGSNSQLKSLTSEHVTLDLNDIRALANGKLSNGNMYNSVATSDSDHEEPSGTQQYKNIDPTEQATLQARKLPELPKTPESTGLFLILY